jgi:hypothetical protein
VTFQIGSWLPPFLIPFDPPLGRKRVVVTKAWIKLGTKTQEIGEALRRRFRAVEVDLDNPEPYRPQFVAVPIVNQSDQL